MSLNNYTPEQTTGDYTFDDAVAICKMIEPLTASVGFHVALTGGTLYGEGGRKDIDLVLYRIRQVESPNIKLLFTKLATVDIVLEGDYGFCKKFLLAGVVPLDIMFPEDWVGDYPLQHLMVEGITET